ncbi:hypothetical protein ACIPJM_25120 [Streptomyces halstedii]|uniref:hypothetical protein n=1 Tax=Streptomyces halstedii TaxID=1944 RepID=UPI00380349F7
MRAAGRQVVRDARTAPPDPALTELRSASQHLLATRLQQLREQTADRTTQAVAAPWTDRLPELAARQLDADASGAMIA